MGAGTWRGPRGPVPAAVEDGLAAYAGLLESGASPARAVVAWVRLRCSEQTRVGHMVRL